jgi:hypothetical protein
MIFRRYGTFTGGIDLPDEKRPTLGLDVLAPLDGRVGRIASVAVACWGGLTPRPPGRAARWPEGVGTSHRAGQ